MNAEHDGIFQSTSQEDQIGITGTVKNLCEVFSNKLPKSCDSKNKLFTKCYEILLKKGETKFPEGLPSDWDDDDVINAIQYDIFKRCKIKQTWTKELCNKVIKNSQALRKYKDTEFYKNSISPALRMLLYLAYLQQKQPVPEKKVDRFFNTDVISNFFDNSKSFLSREEINPLFFPKIPQLRHSQSDGQLKHLSSNRRFDYIFQFERQTNDLDEGFVTPNEEHIEKSPCFEVKSLPRVIEEKPFFWDLAVTIPPSRHKSWEKYGTIGERRKQLALMRNDVLVLDWLKSAPSGVSKISRKQLMDDLLALLVGTPSTTFRRDDINFVVKERTYTDDLTADNVCVLSQTFINSARGFEALTKLCESSDDDGTLSLAFKLALREYLYKYQTAVICSRENLSLKEMSYFKLISTLDPFMQQVAQLTELLNQKVLKGVSLLKDIFDLFIRTSSSSICYILSSLFLLPCTYYFRLIDDWIFLGKWHKDLPLAYCDMSSVRDRQSWLEAHKPVTYVNNWLVSNQELAFCGKAIWLLSFSKNYGTFLNLMRSDNRPKLKICLSYDELRDLRKDCENFFEEGIQLFTLEEKEEIDLALQAQERAQILKEEFESNKSKAKLKEIEKKKVELAVREEDLVRSAHNKELKKLEDELENKRIERDLEEILLKEQQEEIEKAKLILKRYQENLVLEEKRSMLANWKMKRDSLNEKRKEFFNKELLEMKYKNKEDVEKFFDEKLACVIKEESTENSTNLVVIEESRAKDSGDHILGALGSMQELSVDDPNENVTHSQKYVVSDSLNDNMGEIKITATSEFVRNRNKILASDILNSNAQDPEIIKHDNMTGESELQINKNKNLGSQMDYKDIPMQGVGQNYIEDLNSQNAMSENINAQDPEIIKHENMAGESEFQRNKNKIMGSQMDHKDIPMQGVVENDIEGLNSQKAMLVNINAHDPEIIKHENMAGDSELQINKNKIMGSQMDNKDIIMQEVRLNDIEGLNSQNAMSDLEKNRTKVMSSNLGNDRGVKLHIWGEENQRNRKNMLDSHIPFFVEYGIEKSNAEEKLLGISHPSLRSTKKGKNDRPGKQDNNERSLNIIQDNEQLQINDNICVKKESTQVCSITKDSEKIAIDTQDCEQEKVNNDADVSIDFDHMKPSWFKGVKSWEADKFRHIFKMKRPSLIQNEDADFTLLNKLVPQSLMSVLGFQTRLINKALLNMFLKEFELLKVAQNLRKYFFLHGEFGKRLTSSLSKAIESEEPSTLLTFYRLRSILAEASKGDIKEISFVVKDTPNAFEHSDSQVLSCLGLAYKFDWPLNLIFTDKAISKYNDVFSYMFALQRVTWHLERVDHVLHFKPADLKGDQYNKIQLYRFVMLQFVKALMSYIVTTVIENCWQDFVKSVPKIKDIDELYRRHAMYIKDINSKCFLDERSRRIRSQIEKLLRFIIVYCRTLLYGEWTVNKNDEYLHSNFENLKRTFSSFLSHARYVTKYIEKLVRVNYHNELENLYYYLTMNSFYIS